MFLLDLNSFSKDSILVKLSEDVLLKTSVKISLSNEITLALLTRQIKISEFFNVKSEYL